MRCIKSEERGSRGPKYLCLKVDLIWGQDHPVTLHILDIFEIVSVFGTSASVMILLIPQNGSQLHDIFHDIIQLTYLINFYEK